MANAYIDTADYKRILKKFKNLGAINSKGFPLEFQKFASGAEIDMKNDVPVDTSALKNSISSQAEKKEATIQASMKYAPYIEFGTGRKVKLSHLKKLGIPERYALRFKGRGIKEVNIPPRPYFYTNAYKHYKKLIKNLNSKIKNML